ncbi:MAG: flagellar motor switch protein FliN [Candidatus Marinimicrobia bacterium]|nr:flagellar motor switch protein FliN [Candidatus Neomarinimicrobiota bacterium]
MVGGDPPEEIGDEHLDAVKEAVGQIIGQLQAAFDGEDGAFTPGEVAISQLASADELALPEGGLVATYSFSRGDDATKHLITHIVQGELAAQEDEAAPAEEAAGAEAGEGAEEILEAESEAATAEGAEDAPEAEDATGVEGLLADDFGEEVPTTILEDTSAEEAADELTDLVAETAGIDDIFGEDLDEPVGAGEPSSVEASPVQFDEFGPSPKTDGQGRQIDMLLDVELDVTVELGRKIMLVEEILRLGKGSVVELDKLAGEPVDILVNGKKLAEGEVVVVEDHFGVRLTNLINPRERIRSLGKA